VIERLVLASRNAGKLREFTRLLAPLAIEVIAQAELGIRGCRRAAHHVRRECARQGAAREPAREASGARRRFGRVRCRVERCARRALGALCRRAEIRRAQQREADQRRWRASPTAARITTACSCWSGTRRSRAVDRRGAWHGTIAARHAAMAGFGYDPYFVDAATGLTAPNCRWPRRTSCRIGDRRCAR
jgi:XTP/dITP diphosphohydrolase